jgi:hypothetical protein
LAAVLDLEEQAIASPAQVEREHIVVGAHAARDPARVDELPVQPELDAVIAAQAKQDAAGTRHFDASKGVGDRMSRASRYREVYCVGFGVDALPPESATGEREGGTLRGCRPPHSAQGQELIALKGGFLRRLRWSDLTVAANRDGGEDEPRAQSRVRGWVRDGGAAGRSPAPRTRRPEHRGQEQHDGQCETTRERS